MQEFLKMDGAKELTKVVTVTTKTTQAYGLTALDLVLSESQKEFEISEQFISQILSLCSSTTVNTIKSALSILSKIINITGTHKILHSLSSFSSFSSFLVFFSQKKFTQKKRQGEAISSSFGKVEDRRTRHCRLDFGSFQFVDQKVC